MRASHIGTKASTSPPKVQIVVPSDRQIGIAPYIHPLPLHTRLGCTIAAHGQAGDHHPRGLKLGPSRYHTTSCRRHSYNPVRSSTAPIQTTIGLTMQTTIGLFLSCNRHCIRFAALSGASQPAPAELSVDVGAVVNKMTPARGWYISEPICSTSYMIRLSELECTLGTLPLAAAQQLSQPSLSTPTVALPRTARGLVAAALR